MSEELIDRLSLDLRPARRGIVALRLVAALLAGAGVALVGVALVLGFRADMPRALGSGMFWAKLAYGLSIATLGAWCVERLARPAGVARRRARWLLIPAAGILVMAAVQLARSTPSAWRDLVMGQSAMVCPWRILLTSLPVLIALMWALRGLAPTRPRLAGAVAGLTAGASGAAIYALHCPEVGAPFVAIWYSLGVLLSAVLGALAGPRLLRW